METAPCEVIIDEHPALVASSVSRTGISAHAPSKRQDRSTTRAALSATKRLAQEHQGTPLKGAKRARVKTHGEVLREYEFHLGAKSADAKGKPSSKQTFGLLRRRHERVERIIYIGKESNRLEEQKRE